VTPVRLGRRDALVPDAYDEGRQLLDKAIYSTCYAPSTSMYFDQFGHVRACCQNTGGLLGKVTEQSIREIWDSADASRLRDALAVGDFSEGCGFCGWQVEQGDHQIVYARNFDEHPVAEQHPHWPVQMEFSMTNSCNLQCAMCNGDWSSSIRTHREQRPPLPAAYSEAFFEELVEFLPHLEKANFLGGEPFLGSEPLRVMGMLAELDHPPAVAATTNGTQWSPRIERICESLPISFVLSLDGVSKQTYESIRIGADFDAVMQNLDRFQEHAERHGTSVTLAHCFMRPNWHEFSRFLRFAEQRGLDVGMNEVLFPAELSLFQMPASELRDVVRTMEDDDANGIAAGLDELRPVWEGQLEALRHRLALLDAGEHGFVRPWADADGTDRSETWEEQAVRVLTEWAGTRGPVRVTLDGTGCTEGLVDERPHVLDRFDLRGAVDAGQVVQILATSFGGPEAVTRRYTDMLDDVVIADANGEGLELRTCWKLTGSKTTMFVSYRNPPAVEARDAMTALYGADRVVVLTCDETGVVVRSDGPVHLLVDGPEPLEGITLLQLQTRVLDRFGEKLIAGPGPSGYPNDDLMQFIDERDLVTQTFRAFTDRRPEHTIVVIAVLAGDAVSPPGSGDVG